MARINRIEKSRKQVTCSKCGKVLPVGSPYLKATPYHRSPIIRCVSCGLQSWETSGSDYVQTLGNLCSNWENDYGCDEYTVDSIVSELEDLRDTCSYNLDNMPYQLQDSSSGEMLQERIDNLEDVIGNLDSLSYDDCYSEAESEVDEDDYEDADDYTADVEDLAKEKLRDAIEDILCELEY